MGVSKGVRMGLLILFPIRSTYQYYVVLWSSLRSTRYHSCLPSYIYNGGELTDFFYEPKTFQSWVDMVHMCVIVCECACAPVYLYMRHTWYCVYVWCLYGLASIFILYSQFYIARLVEFGKFQYVQSCIALATNHKQGDISCDINV